MRTSRTIVSGLSLAALCLSLAARVDAAPLVLYPFSADLLPTIVAPGVTPTLDVSTLLQPPPTPLINDDGYGNILNAYPTSGSTSAALALANDSFFTLALNAAPISLGPLTVQFEVGKGGTSNPRGYFVRSSLDGFAADLFSEALPSGQPPPALRSFGVDATGQTALFLRFYVYTPNPNANSVDFRNLRVDTVPEPTGMVLCGLVLLGAMASRRRAR